MMNFKSIPNTFEMQERYLKSYSADIYDVMDKMGYGNQCLSLAIKPLRDDMKVCGPAFTIYGTQEPRFDAEFPNPKFDNFAQFDRFYKGCVIVINAEKESCSGHWGEMMSYGARATGAVGAVIDGGTRDKMGILKIDNWSCFARYTSPIESKRRWRAKELDCPIFVSGSLTTQVLVRPGDWIFGDADAVVVIPKEILYEVLIAVEDVSVHEELSRKAFTEGEDINSVFAKFKRA